MDELYNRARRIIENWKGRDREDLIPFLKTRVRVLERRVSTGAYTTVVGKEGSNALFDLCARHRLLLFFWRQGRHDEANDAFVQAITIEARVGRTDHREVVLKRLTNSAILLRKKEVRFVQRQCKANQGKNKEKLGENTIWHHLGFPRDDRTRGEDSMDPW